MLLSMCVLVAVAMSVCLEGGFFNGGWWMEINEVSASLWASWLVSTQDYMVDKDTSGDRGLWMLRAVTSS